LPGKGKVAILLLIALHNWRATRCTFQMPTATPQSDSMNTVLADGSLHKAHRARRVSQGGSP